MRNLDMNNDECLQQDELLKLKRNKNSITNEILMLKGNKSEININFYGANEIVEKIKIKSNHSDYINSDDKQNNSNQIMKNQLVLPFLTFFTSCKKLL